MFCIFSVQRKICLKWPQIGPGCFFPTNPDLPNLLGRTYFDFATFFFGFCWIPDLQNSNSGFPDSWISRFLDLGIRILATAGCGSGGGTSRRIWTALPTTEFRRSKELGQYRDNPYQCKPCLGIIQTFKIGST